MSNACTLALKMLPSVHLERSGTGMLQLGCLVAADIAALERKSTAAAVLIRCWGMDVPIWH